MNQFDRVIQMKSKEFLVKLQDTTVMVLGVGGVGSFAVEALVRTGLGKLIIVDSDDYDLTNLNRQWPSNHDSLGKAKVEVIKEECLRINPKIEVEAICLRLNECNYQEILRKIEGHPNAFLIDAIDDIKIKISILTYALEKRIKVISSMGAANICDISKIKQADISKTEYCPVARVVRNALKEKRIHKGLPVVFSTEERADITPHTKGSIMSITAAFGLNLASWVLVEINRV